MSRYASIGEVDWSNEDIVTAIPEFLELYNQRPILINEGGMKTPHMFATWFLLRKINPSIVIESGVWKGQSTWLIEKTLPNAFIYSIDPRLDLREYISEKAVYFDKDFSLIDWSIISDKNKTLCFFDDHQNCFERVVHCKRLGFKECIFEDNYPTKQGDCYSLKKVFSHTGFKPEDIKQGVFSKLLDFFKASDNRIIKPNSADAAYLKESLSVYYEFPPIYRCEYTRWGDKWDDIDYPTPPSIFSREDDLIKQFVVDAMYYTWICYAKLN